MKKTSKKTSKKETYRKTTMPVVCLRAGYIGGGSECDFYCAQNKTRRAYKIYSRADHARRAFDRQKKASKIGLAPKVYGEPFAAVSWDEHYFIGFGYETQFVKVLLPDEVLEVPQEAYEKMHEIAGRLGINDIHEANFGMINRKMVAVDFGDSSY